MGNSQHHIPTLFALPFRGAAPSGDRSDGSDLGGGGDVRALDAPPAFRLLDEFPDHQVPPGADNGDGGDIGGGACAARAAELAADVEVGVGARGRRVGSKRVVVVHSGGAAAVHLQRRVRAGLDRVLHQSLSESVGLRALIGGICRNALSSSAQHQYASLFSNSEEVEALVYQLTPFVVISVIINNVQPVLSVLSGVAIGAGWQGFVAYVNVGCYYIFGIPVGLVLGYLVDFGVKGIWIGMLSGTMSQTLILFGMVYKTNWKKEASIARDRIKQWGGSTD